MDDSLSVAVETALGVGTKPADTPETPIGSGTPDASEDHSRAVKRRKHSDHHLWGTYLLLVFIAIIELFSASIQEVNDGNIFGPIIRHGAFLLAGLVMMLIIERIHYRYIFGFIPIYVAFSVGLMILVYFVGSDINGAQRAIRIAGVPILPAEFMKLGAAMGMAWILAKTQMKGMRDVTTTGLVWSIIFLGLCCGLLFSQGLSNTLVTAAIGLSMMLVGGMSWKKFGIVILVFGIVGAVALTYKMTSQGHEALSERQLLTLELNKETLEGGVADGRGETWKNRLKRHFRSDKHLDKFDVKNQQEQLSYIAQAHGGILGVGPGMSRENARLPLAFSDYIFAIIIEELGLLAGLAILAIYMWILGRSAKLTIQFKHTVPGVLVMGCSFVIVFQALYHMAMVSGVFPVSGQPLPLISKGGISVLATSLAFGVMLSVSRHAARVSDTSDVQKEELEMLPENAQSVNPVQAAVVISKNTEQ